MKQNNEEFSLKDLWGFIVQKLWIIVIVAIIGAVATFVYTLISQRDSDAVVCELTLLDGGGVVCVLPWRDGGGVDVC